MGPGDALSLVDLALSLCRTIHDMVSNIKTNKQFCQQLGERVKTLENLVLTINKRPTRISSTVYKALKTLCESLDSARHLMLKFSNTTAFKSFLMSSSLKDKFQNVDKRLHDDLNILSGALLVEQGDVLYKVYDTVKGRRRAPHCPPPLPPPPSLQPLISTFTPTATAPVSCIVSPMQSYRPMTPVPVSCIMAPMALPGTTTPISFSTTIVSKAARMSRSDIRSLMASRPVTSHFFAS